MMSRYKGPFLTALLGLLVTCSQGATITQPYNGSFPATISGTLPDQSSVLFETFTLPSASNLAITTNSYVAGGFEPNLFLFNSVGALLQAGAPFGNAAPSTGIVGDMRLVASSLPAGSYTLAVTDFLLNQSLTATNLSQGFTQNYGNGTTFIDSNGNQRTGNYSFTIAATSTAAVPEPATLWLAAPLLGAVLVKARKRRDSVRA